MLVYWSEPSNDRLNIDKKQEVCQSVILAMLCFTMKKQQFL